MSRSSDNSEAAVGCAFVIFWIFSVLMSLAVLGVGIWAVIEIVQWLTSK